METGVVEPPRTAATPETVQRTVTDFPGRAERGGSILGAIAGATVVVLSIIGLAGVGVGHLLPIAAIVFGTALLFEGAASGMQRTGGLSTEFVGGIAGIVLGVLALLGVASGILTSSALIVFGGAVFLGAVAHSQRVFASDALSREMVLNSIGAHVLAGMSVVILGILSLVGVGPAPTLTFVGLLTLGAFQLLAGLASTNRLAER
jgi:hypothetical protein